MFALGGVCSSAVVVPKRRGCVRGVLMGKAAGEGFGHGECDVTVTIEVCFPVQGVQHRTGLGLWKEKGGRVALVCPSCCELPLQPWRGFLGFLRLFCSAWLFCCPPVPGK